MTDERKQILDKVNHLLNKKIGELIKILPDVHEIADGIIIRFFNDWGECKDNADIKYKVISNINDSNELIVFHFIPKNTILSYKKREYVRSIICLSGCLELNVNGILHRIDKYSKIRIENNKFEGIAFEDTYIITSMN